MDPGETVGILGESGCGKTTLASAIMRILPDNGKIEEGKIIFKNRDLLSLDEEEMRMVRWGRISMIFQAAMNAFNPVYTIKHQIAEAMYAHDKTLTPQHAEAEIIRLLQMVNLPAGVMDKYPHQLSGGMKQRAIIAMALSCGPEMILADEPTTALDVIVQDRILKNLNDVQKKLGTAMLYISHDISVLAEVSDRIFVMYAGKIVEETDVERIFISPVHPYTAGLVGAFPLITGEKKELFAVPGDPPSLLNPPPGCRFHPRCSRAIPVCKDEEPVLEDKKDSGRAACFNPVAE